MATISKQKCRAYGTLSGNSPQVGYFVQGTAETFKKGALLHLTASGTVRVMVATDGAAFTAKRKRVIGIAGADADNYTLQATANAGTKMPVFLANSDTLFISNALNSTSVATSSLAHTDVGKAMTASVNGSMMFVDLSASAASSILKVHQLIDSAGDTYGRVLWQLLSGAYALGR